jgi:hypothetical protein
LVSISRAITTIESAARDVSIEIELVQGLSLANAIEHAQIKIAETIENSYQSAIKKLDESRRY